MTHLSISEKQYAKIRKKEPGCKRFTRINA